jgi:hypothetical protein
MKPLTNNHRQSVEHYLYSTSIEALNLSAREIEVINAFLARLYAELGNIIWIKVAFTTTLNAYWNKAGAAKEDALQYEALIGPDLQRVIAARQFTRAPSDVIKSYIREPTANIANYWIGYYDPYPPPGIERMGDPYRSFFLLVSDLVQQMNRKDDVTEAVRFLASLMAAFCLTYPTSYLASDTFFQAYVEKEVNDEPVDDDFTYFLSRDLDYMLLDRS